MSRIVTLKLLRTSKFDLDKARDESKLIEGEPYFVTDEARMAVATAVNSYRSMVKREGDTMVGKLIAREAQVAGGAGFSLQQGVTPASLFDGDIWITPDGLFHRSNAIPQRMATEYELPQTDNIIVNGDFYYNSFGGAFPAGSTAGTFFCDQWRGYNSTDASVVISRNATAPLISKYGNPLQCTVTASTADASLAASQLLMVYQYLEAYKLVRWGWGYNMAVASQPHMYVRFTARVNRAGTYYFTIISADGGISHPIPWVIDAADINTSKEFVLRIPPPPLTPGVWNLNNRSCWVAWTFASGTTYQNAVTNSWVSGAKYCGQNISTPLQSAGFTATITDISIGQMVSGSSGLIAPPHRRKPYTDALAEMQRYYQTISIWWSGDAQASQTYYSLGYTSVPWAPTTYPPPPVTTPATPATPWPIITRLSGSQTSIFPAAPNYSAYGPAIRDYRTCLTTPATQATAYFYSHVAIDARH